MKIINEATKNNAKYLKLLDINLAPARAIINSNDSLNNYVKVIRVTNLESLQLGMDFDKDWINSNGNGLGTPVIVVKWKNEPKNAYKNKVLNIIKKYLTTFNIVKEESYKEKVKWGDIDESYIYLSKKIEGIKRSAADNGGLTKLRSYSNTNKNNEQIFEVVLKNGKVFQKVIDWTKEHKEPNITYIEMPQFDQDDLILHDIKTWKKFTIPIDQIKAIYDKNGKDITNKFHLNLPGGDTSGKTYDIEKTKNKKKQLKKDLLGEENYFDY